MYRSSALTMGLLLLGTSLAAAQTPPVQSNPAAPTTSPTTNCAPTGATTGSGQSGSDLSSKLAQSNGVLCPPAGIDPDMHVPPPQGGALRVLPAPGTPGGDQRVVPK